jgi:hypothetical protein
LLLWFFYLRFRPLCVRSFNFHFSLFSFSLFYVTFSGTFALAALAFTRTMIPLVAFMTPVPTANTDALHNALTLRSVLNQTLIFVIPTQYESSVAGLPKIATDIGVFSATLSMWIAGTTKPSRTELLAIKNFLERRG